MNNQTDILKAFNCDFDLVLSKKEIKEKSGINYYYNVDKHLGDMLSRMVDNGKLIRVKIGRYKLGSGVKHIENNKQIKLF